MYEKNNYLKILYYSTILQINLLHTSIKFKKKQTKQKIGITINI